MVLEQWRHNHTSLYRTASAEGLFFTKVRVCFLGLSGRGQLVSPWGLMEGERWRRGCGEVADGCIIRGGHGGTDGRTDGQWSVVSCWPVLCKASVISVQNLNFPHSYGGIAK